MIKLNFTNNLAAQDMIRIVMKEKDLAEKEAIEYSINRDIYQKILEEGYASIALDIWGHDNPEREWSVLDKPIFELSLDKLKERLVEDIAEKEDVDTETAICYFLIFTMDFLGYHI
ncbi:MAG TPA: hypothetical protein DEQ02_00235 [Ruminococcaceae bacterium]|nr:hypothetical protein [Oscillospiraceae bacterium]